MATTVLQQLCNTTQLPAGNSVFNVASSVVEPGDLPQIEIFVFSIVSATNPKADTFLRVGTVYDLTTVTIGRNSAIIAGQSLYLSAGFTVTFTDVQTATQAKLLVQSRVDQLILDWDTYQQDFIVPSIIDIPLESSSLLTAAIQAYFAAVTAAATAATTAAGTAATAASMQALLTAASSQLTADQTALAQQLAWQTTLSGVNAAETAFTTAAQTLWTAGQTFYAPNTGGPGAATFNTALGAFVPAQAAEQANLHGPIGALVTSLGSSVSALQGKVIADQGVVSTAQTNYNNAVTANNSAQALLTAANTSVATTLAAVIAFSPSFAPYTYQLPPATSAPVALPLPSGFVIA